MKEIEKIKKAKVLIVGDIMLDTYYIGTVNRISPEAPVPIFNLKETNSNLGGAANVASNVATLGASSTIIGCLGNDDNGRILKSLLTSTGIHDETITSNKIKTITKTRIVNSQQQLIRFDIEKNFDQELSQEIFEKFKSIYKNFEIIVFSDYAKGTLYNIADLINLANDSSIFTIVDPKGLDFEKYKNSSLITPNLKEFSDIVGASKNDTDEDKKAVNLLNNLSLEYLLLTKGESGIKFFQKNKERLIIKAEAIEVFDVTGAGDTVVATAAVAIAAGFEIERAIDLANKAASIVVSKHGTSSIKLDEIAKFLNDEKNSSNKIVNLKVLDKIIKKEKKNGGKIVMTNGCFDILHPGHIEYLKKAKLMGDLLIVAINTNNSIKKLKGPQRPINDLIFRERMLEAYDFIDYIIAFDDETPKELIIKIMPDILVKGGDYLVEEIAGSDYVLNNGGEVKTIPLISGFSSTSLIDKIKNL